MFGGGGFGQNQNQNQNQGFGQGFNNGGGFRSASANGNPLASRLGPKVEQSPQLVDIEVRNWEGGGKDDCVAFLQRKSRIQLQNVWVSGPILHGQVRPQDARPLAKFSGIRFAGQVLRISIASENGGNGGGAGNGGRNQLVQILSTFLKQRYNPEAKVLDLQSYKSDQFLAQNQLFDSASTSTKMFPALMKIAADEKLNVETMNLASNGLQDVSSISAIASTFPGLKNLSLANNAISKVRGLDGFRMNLSNLRELVLSGNPIVNEPNYKMEVIKMFPRLILLDGQVVRDESQIDRMALPLPVTPMFFENADIQAVVGEFLPSYFNFFDTDRNQLLTLYDNESTLSLSLNSNSPRVIQSNPAPSSWSAYVSISRNLERLSSATARRNRLCVGSQAISSLFKKIPETKHSIVQNPEKMAVEAWLTHGVRNETDAGIVICVHGEFSERNNVLRSFDRTFILVPGSTQKYLIATELITIRGYGGYDSWFVDRTAAANRTQSPATVDVGQQNAGFPPVAGIAGAAGVPGIPVGSGIPVELQGLAPAHLAVVRDLMQQTGLNAQFARMCAEQASFDLNQALGLFQQSRPQLPQNAFT